MKSVDFVKNTDFNCNINNFVLVCYGKLLRVWIKYRNFDTNYETDKHFVWIYEMLIFLVNIVL